MRVIFISSDYVFDGKSGPYDDEAVTAPTTEYGRLKVAVEQEISSLVRQFTVMRLSKIYGVAKGDATLLDEMASSLAAGKEIRVARDQVFCPTYVGDLVRTVLQAQLARICGHLNVCNPERWSRAEVALALAAAMGVNTALARQISLYDIPAMVGRPLDTSMACSRLIREVKPTFTPLKDNILKVAANWSGGETA